MLFSQLSVLAFLLEFLSAFHLSNHVILDTVFLGFSIACFTARQPKHICKKCFHLITDPSREKPMAFRAFRWHLERSLGHAPCDLDRHMPLPTSRSQGWSRGHIPLPQANFSKIPAGARWPSWTWGLGAGKILLQIQRLHGQAPNCPRERWSSLGGSSRRQSLLWGYIYIYIRYLDCIYILWYIR